MKQNNIPHTNYIRIDAENSAKLHALYKKVGGRE